MEQQVLSIEQMQHLQKLGVDTSKASMQWWRRVTDFRGDKVEGRWHISLNTLRIVQNFESDEVIPAFTLQDILDMLPRHIECKHGFYNIAIQFCTDGYIISYDSPDGHLKLSPEHSLIDAAYEMLCWCIEQGYVETKKVK